MAHLKQNIASVIFLLLLVFLCTNVSAQKIIDNDKSMWNSTRALRKYTLLIVVNTTEAGDQSSLNSVKKSGTCNYLITTDGKIHTIIDPGKIAMHAGRSMWNGHTDLSESTIGIEVVGYHNKKPTEKQLISLNYLIAKLQAMYKLKDKDVVTHSMIAYGTPNKYYHFNHRGRKRCGMIFRKKDVIKKIGLTNVANFDPDVKAGRLKNADPYLAEFLYGKQLTVVIEKPFVKGVTDPSNEPDEKFEGFTEVGKEGVYSIAGADYRSMSTIYFFPNGIVRTGAELSTNELNSLPKGTKVLVGYTYGGKITKEKTAYSKVGNKWNSPSTFYLFPDKTIKNGDEVDGHILPKGVTIFFRSYRGK